MTNLEHRISLREKEIRRTLEQYQYEQREGLGIPQPPDWTTDDICYLLFVIDQLRKGIEP